MKKLPPYGAKLKALLTSNQKLNNDVFCFCGKEAWQRAASSSKCRLTLCLPYKANPFEFHWPVQDVDILLYETGDMQALEIERFVYCLLEHEALVVRVVTHDPVKLFVYRKEVLN